MSLVPVEITRRKGVLSVGATLQVTIGPSSKRKPKKSPDLKRERGCGEEKGSLGNLRPNQMALE